MTIDWNVVAIIAVLLVVLLGLSLTANRYEREAADDTAQAVRMRGITWGGTRVLLERRRQIVEEGYAPERDLQLEDGSLATAAMAYAAPWWLREQLGWGNDPPFFWPWSARWWKPCVGHGRPGRIRELEKAGALIIAELDRLHAMETAEVAALAAGRVPDPARA